ncbi:hypothetical protein B0H66DRAFT_469031 [Apodospora peruviana]|uniref:Clr5 domain-containing protein n=1 Tax=Apodospora peruviana TaxID=516989 RepID=A0AAE0IU91_9PEZI|nr:hypothetical protein B0H66DRAFT_469031 [Apodospora peruviana]
MRLLVSNTPPSDEDDDQNAETVFDIAVLSSPPPLPSLPVSPDAPDLAVVSSAPIQLSLPTPSFGENGASGLSTAISDVSPERPLVPTSAADWESKKAIIQELYMNKNLILNDVVDIMLSTHNFKATARMYKGQFAKWRWTKYNKSGNPSSSSNYKTKSRPSRRTSTALVGCAMDHVAKPALPQSRRPPSQPAELLRLLYQNEDTFQVESTLNAYSSYISKWSERETPWRSSLGFHDVMSQENSILQNFSIALAHFGNARTSLGGEVLRRAFLQIEDAVATGFDIQAIWDCCLAVPQLVLHLGWTDILLIFTRYLHKLTIVKMAGHPIAMIARNLYELSHRDPEQLKLYIDKGWKLWIDMVGRVRGDHDHVTIHLKRGYVILMKPEQSIVKNLLNDFGESVQKSLVEYGQFSTTQRILELEQLLVRMYIPLFSDESSDRARSMLSGVLARIEQKPSNKGQPVNKWNYLDRYLFFSAYHFLASIADYNGEYAQAADYRRKSLASPKDQFWLQTALRLEEYLRSEGKEEEADDILKERLQVPLVEYHEHPDYD